MTRNAFRLFAVGCILALTGCATLDRHDRNMLVQHGISQPLYDRMRDDEPLTLNDVVELSRRHVPPHFIVRYLDETNTVIHLSRGDTQRLSKAGVDAEVIDYLLSTDVAYSPGTYYPDYPPYYPASRPWYPYYPWRFYFGFPSIYYGGGYYRHHHWH